MSSDLEDLAPDTSTPHRPMSSNNKKRTLGEGLGGFTKWRQADLPLMTVSEWQIEILETLTNGWPYTVPLDAAQLIEAGQDAYATLGDQVVEDLTDEEISALHGAAHHIINQINAWAGALDWGSEDEELKTSHLLFTADMHCSMRLAKAGYVIGYLAGNPDHANLATYLNWDTADIAANVTYQWADEEAAAVLEGLAKGPQAAPLTRPRSWFHPSKSQPIHKRLKALTDDYMAALAETVAITGIEAAPRPMKSEVILSTSKLARNFADWAPQGGADLAGRKSKDTAVTAGPHPGDLIANLTPVRGTQLAHLDYRHVAVSDAIGSLKRAVDGHADTSTRIGLSDIAKHLMGNKRGARLSDELLEEVEDLIDDLEATYATVTGTNYNGVRVDLRGHLVTAYKVVFTHPNGATSTGYRVFDAPILFAASEHINQAKQVDAALEGYSPGKRRTLPAMITARWITSYLPYWAATGATRVEVYIEPPTKKPRRPPPVLATALGDKSPLTRRRQRTLTEYLTAALDHLKARGYVTAYEDLYEGRKRVGVTIYLPATMPALDAAKR